MGKKSEFLEFSVAHLRVKNLHEPWSFDSKFTPNEK